MKDKQTAVDWLITQLEGEESLVARIVGLKEYNQIVKQAKQMEKEQMAEKYDEGHADGYYSGCQDFEEYKQQGNGQST
jgi:hypothetical protein